ncbi:hypothetical protein C8R41DRAFT_826386 [Lentinula lateritia]|uniref:Uncharacterized protein n=1 Tax=Lentinula lateritia TaxID=40482 RepID=A0ABQ8VJ61_9AGAR|nr:hypothetical protein C8R41DRAFT_826386 [Lentinula lateritia]
MPVTLAKRLFSLPSMLVTLARRLFSLPSMPVTLAKRLFSLPSMPVTLAKSLSFSDFPFSRSPSTLANRTSVTAVYFFNNSSISVVPNGWKRTAAVSTFSKEPAGEDISRD